MTYSASCVAADFGDSVFTKKSIQIRLHGVFMLVCIEVTMSCESEDIYVVFEVFVAIFYYKF